MSSSTTTTTAAPTPTHTRFSTAGYKITAPYLYVIPIALTVVICGFAAFFYRSVLLRRRQRLMEELIRGGVVLPGSLTAGPFGYMTLSSDVRAEIERRRRLNGELKPRLWEAFVEKKVNSEDSKWEWDEITPFSGMYVTEAEDGDDGHNPGKHQKSRLRRLFRHRDSDSASHSGLEPINNTRRGDVLELAPQNKLRVAVFIAMPSTPVPVLAAGLPPAHDASGSSKSKKRAIKPNVPDKGDEPEPEPVLPHLEFGVAEVDVPVVDV